MSTQSFGPAWIREKWYSPERDRQVIRALRRQPGIQDPTDFQAFQTTPASWQVRVTRGRCVIDGDVDTYQQGSYVCTEPADTFVDVPVSDANSPTVTFIVAQVDDSDFSGPALDWGIRPIAGTPGGGPPDTLVLMPGGGYQLLNTRNAIPLWRVDVPAGALAVTQSMLTDLRNPVNPIFTVQAHTLSLWPLNQNIPMPRTAEALMQTGHGVFRTNPFGAATVVYPRPFQNALYAVFCQYEIGHAPPVGFFGVVPFDFRANLFQALVYNMSNQPVANQDVTLVWMAFGW